MDTVELVKIAHEYAQNIIIDPRIENKANMIIVAALITTTINKIATSE